MNRTLLARFAHIADAIEQRAFFWLVAPVRRRRHERLLAAELRILSVLGAVELNFSYDIGRAAGLRPARLYRALDRLMQKGLVIDGWEDEPVRPRRWYQLTEDGRRLVAIRQAATGETGEGA